MKIDECMNGPSAETSRIQLIGMLDSPYVRRVAITMKVLDLPFEHRSLSVFSAYEEFSKLNDVVKAPTLITSSGTVLMDSTLILQYVESIAPYANSFMMRERPAREGELRRIGLALAACDKTVQLVYETKNRPMESQYRPWVDRVTLQIRAAYGQLEREMPEPHEIDDWSLNQEDITTAVAWTFTSYALPGLIERDKHPRVAAHTAAAEALPVFMNTPLE